MKSMWLLSSPIASTGVVSRVASRSESESECESESESEW
jgi:hypothetical protein